MIIKINHLMIMRFVTLEFISKIDDPFGDSEIAHPRHKSRDEVEKRWEKTRGKSLPDGPGHHAKQNIFHETLTSFTSQRKVQNPLCRTCVCISKPCVSHPLLDPLCLFPLCPTSCNSTCASISCAKGCKLFHGT